MGGMTIGLGMSSFSNSFCLLKKASTLSGDGVDTWSLTTLILGVKTTAGFDPLVGSSAVTSLPSYR